MARVRKSKSSLRQSESLLEQAADVAASGDLPSAESLLREALAIQEARLGADHPALATTLNNLAIACEAIDKLPDAERFYRRAHAIALDSFDRSHPQVSTSRRNLEEFCRTHGLEADAGTLDQRAGAHGESRSALEAFVSEGQAWVAPPPSWSVQEEPVVDESVPVIHDLATGEPEAPDSIDVPDAAVLPEAPAERRPWLRIGTLGAALVVTAVMGGTWFGTTGAPGSRVAQPIDTPTPSGKSTMHSTELAESSGPAAVDKTPLAAPAVDKPVVHPEPPAAEPSSSPVVTAGAAAPAKAVATTGTQQEAGVPVRVMNAQLCRELGRGPGAWKCEAPENPTGAGILYFYTRVVSASPGDIEHRWYRGDALIQRVPLRVTASPAGYRTFSRQTTNAGSGNWRVELHSPDGTLLDERRFVIQ